MQRDVKSAWILLSPWRFGQHGLYFQCARTDIDNLAGDVIAQ